MSEIKLTSVIDGDDLIVNDVDSDEEDYDDDDFVVPVWFVILV